MRLKLCDIVTCAGSTPPGCETQRRSTGALVNVHSNSPTPTRLSCHGPVHCPGSTTPSRRRGQQQRAPAHRLTSHPPRPCAERLPPVSRSTGQSEKSQGKAQSALESPQHLSPPPPVHSAITAYCPSPTCPPPPLSPLISSHSPAIGRSSTISSTAGRDSILSLYPTVTLPRPHCLTTWSSTHFEAQSLVVALQVALLSFSSSSPPLLHAEPTTALQLSAVSEQQ